MLDAVLLASFDWTPSSLSDIEELPDRVLWLYVSYRNGQQAELKATKPGG